jgi:hypothetical protein
MTIQRKKTTGWGAGLAAIAMGAAPGRGEPAEAPGAAAAPVAAARCVDFLNSIGANSAISRRGESLERTIECARYVGLRWFRSGYESGVPTEDQIEVYRQTGARFSYGLLSGGSDTARLLDGARKLAAAGALLAIEGNNEPNNWGVKYQRAPHKLSVPIAAGK